MNSVFQFCRTSASIRIVLLIWFLLIFLLSSLTPYLADDFYYMYSIATREPISTPAMLYDSMRAHALIVNGRLVTHTILQVLLLLPKTVFNLCNAFAFSWLLYACYRICNYGKEPNAWIMLAIGMAFWLCSPGFGESFLWFAGAVNYLWALAFCMVFLSPFITCALGIQEKSFFPFPKRTAGKGLFIVFSFLFGAYSEITSFVAVLMAVGCMLGTARPNRKGRQWLWLCVAAAVLGYIWMLSMPAEMNKNGGLALSRLFLQIPRKTAMLKDFFCIPIAVWFSLLVLSFRNAISRKKRILSVWFFLGALVGNYCLIAASYVARRCLSTTELFLILACGTLLAGMWDRDEHGSCRVFLAVLTVLFSLSFIIGSFDIANVFLQARARERAIREQVKEGNSYVYAELLNSSTPYCAAYALIDLDMNNPNAWPNWYIAKYYDAPALLGVDTERQGVLLSD